MRCAVVGTISGTIFQVGECAEDQLDNQNKAYDTATQTVVVRPNTTVVALTDDAPVNLDGKKWDFDLKAIVDA